MGGTPDDRRRTSGDDDTRRAGAKRGAQVDTEPERADPEDLSDEDLSKVSGGRRVDYPTVGDFF
ncbi:MAG: hypothetical protein FJ000_00590 [Actinobacteria bacterium]|nr:hypothetical protein [Actinomycetota bacterium]